MVYVAAVVVVATGTAGRLARDVGVGRCADGDERGGERGDGREAEDDLAHWFPLSMRRDLRREGGHAAAY